MKAQKLGWFLGMNMAVACMVMQGCVNKEMYPEGYKPINRRTHVIATPEAKPVAVETIDVKPVAPEAEKPVDVRPLPAAPEPVAVEPVQTQVVQVKPISAQAAKAPKHVEAVPATPAPAALTHTVARGDSLSGISKRYNVKMASIVAANPGLKPDRIRIGQKIAIPSVAPVAVAAAPAKEPAVLPAAATVEPVAANTVAPVKTKSAFKAYEGPTKEYVVKNGDSLGKIAYENGISIRALKALNSLQKDNVRVGQKLQVPAEKVAAKPVAPVAEKKADKVEAKPAAVTAPVPAPAAEKKPEAAAPAPAPAAAPAVEKKAEEPVAAPAVEEKKVEAPAAETAAPAPAAGPTYKVKEGDDVVSVAINWGISPSQLMDLNDLKAGDPITPGQILKLPATAKQTAP